MNLKTLSNISIALYILTIGLLLISIYTKGKGIDPNPWQIPAYTSLAISAIVGIFLNLLRRRVRRGED